MPINAAHGEWDGNAPKTYILGTTPFEKDALQRNRNGSDVPIPARKPDSVVFNAPVPSVSYDDDYSDPEPDEELEDVLSTPSVLDILKQIEQ